jgi:outer membrane biosynthesis protein TonB
MISRNRASRAALLALAMALPVALAADVVLLNDGKRLEGDITDKGDAIEIKTSYGVLTVTKAEIQRIVKLGEFTDEADVCRKLAAGMMEEALKSEDSSPQRNKKLVSAVELLQKALTAYQEARKFFTGPDHEDLDKTATAILQDIKACREKMASEPAAPAKDPAPAAEPEKKDAVVAKADPKPEIPPAAKPEAKPEPKPDVKPDAKPDAKPDVKTDAKPEAAADAKSPSFKAPNPATAAGRLMIDIRKAVEAQKNPEVHTMANRLLKTFPDAPETAEAQWLVNTLPHPDGRLVCGFDKLEDLQMWRLVQLSRSRMTFSISTESSEVREGRGSCHLSFPPDPPDSSGALVLDLPDFDGTKFKGLSLWLYQYLASPGQLEFAFVPSTPKDLSWTRKFNGVSDLNTCLVKAVSMKFSGWKHLVIPATEFLPRPGKGGAAVDWKDVGALVVYDRSREGVGVILDSLRFQE